MKKKFDQDFCLNLWYDPLGYFRKMNSTLGSVVSLAMFLLSEHLKNGFLHCLYGVDGDILLHPYCFINQRGTVWWSGAGPLTEYHLYSARDTSDISDTHFSHRFEFTLSPSNTFHEYHICSSWDSSDILHTHIYSYLIKSYSLTDYELNMRLACHILPKAFKSLFAHLSRPWSIGWVALSFLFRLLSCYGDTRPNLHFFQYIQA